MAFVGATPTIQYDAPIGPLPKTGEPMAAKLTIGVASIAAATVAHPLLGLLVAGLVIAGTKK